MADISLSYGQNRPNNRPYTPEDSEVYSDVINESPFVHYDISGISGDPLTDTMNLDKKRENSDFLYGNFEDLSGHGVVKMGDLSGEVSTHENVISIDGLNDDENHNIMEDNNGDDDDDDGDRYDNNRRSYDENDDRGSDRSDDEDDEDGNFNIVEKYQKDKSPSRKNINNNASYNGSNSVDDDIEHDEALTDITTVPADQDPSYSENPISYGDINHYIGEEYGDNEGDREEEGGGGDYGDNNEEGGEEGEEYGDNYEEEDKNQGNNREEEGDEYGDNIEGGQDDTNDDYHSLDGLSDHPITVTGDDSGYDDNAITADDLGTLEGALEPLDGMDGIDQLSDRSKTPDTAPEIPEITSQISREFANYGEIQKSDEIQENTQNNGVVDFEVKVVERYEVTDNPMRKNIKPKIQQVTVERADAIAQINSPHYPKITQRNSPHSGNRSPASSNKDSPYSSSKNSPNRRHLGLGNYMQHTSDDNMEDDNVIHYGKNMNDIEDNTSIKSNFYDHGLYNNGITKDALSSPRSPKFSDLEEIRNNERIEKQISDEIENGVIGEIGEIQGNGNDAEMTVTEKYEKYEKYEITDNPMRVDTRGLKSHQVAFERSEEITDVEIEDSFVFEQMSRSPLLLENDELKKNLIESYDENKRLKDDMREMRIFFNNRENEITNSAESTIISMENEFHEERMQFDEERRMFIAKQNHFKLDQHDLEDEVKILKSKIKLLTHSNIENQEESKEAKSLLTEINRIKAVSSVDEMELKRQLNVAIDKITKFENDAVAMSMLKLAMENRIDLLEDEKEFEFQKHEEQVTGLLKAAGLYDKSGYDHARTENDTGNRSILSDTWVELFRKQLDEERMKINALKDCLIQFSPKLSKDDNDTLHQAGIILVPASTPPTTPLSAPTIGSRFRRFSFTNNKTEKTPSSKTPSEKASSTKIPSGKVVSGKTESAKAVGSPVGSPPPEVAPESRLI